MVVLGGTRCVARFYQVAPADYERLNNDSEARRTCIQRGGDQGVLSGVVDTVNDHFICP
jgi:hypothetical protein